jgi:hypothetical protein
LNTSQIPLMSLCLCVSVCVSSIVVGNGSIENVTAAKNKHIKIEELLDASFSMLFVSCQRKLGD